MNLWAIFYNLFILPIIFIAYKFAYAFNAKVRRRERDYAKYLSQVPKKDMSKLRILFHASSLGEFEQAKPVIERLKRNKDNIEIIASFYSPSGLENSLNYQFVDYNVYMPFDSISNAKKFVEITNPDVVVFVRYDVWRNHIALFKYKRKPLILINASQPSNFLKNFPVTNSFYKDLYSFFDEIYTLNSENFKYFNSLRINSEVIESADTRYDRIMEKVTENLGSDIIDTKIFRNRKVLVMGSSWEEDENLFANALNKYSNEIFTIIVPHEPTPEHIISTKLLFPNAVLLSELNEHQESNFNFIIVDSIGKLLQLYSYADAAYVGGGISKSVHSVSEPSGYSIPLACGPKIERSPDALDLEKLGSLSIIKSKDDVERFISLILNEEKREQVGFISGSYIKEKIGSSNLITNKILNIAEKKINLTKK